MVTGGGKSHREFPTENQINRKKSAKEHDFLDKKHPHSQCIGIYLLRHIIKLVLKARWMIMMMIVCIYVCSHLFLVICVPGSNFADLAR